MSKSIRRSEDAYERLTAHKGEDQTFSEVVLRLAGDRSLLELAGTLNDEGQRHCVTPSTNVASSKEQRAS